MSICSKRNVLIFASAYFIVNFSSWCQSSSLSQATIKKDSKTDINLAIKNVLRGIIKVNDSSEHYIEKGNKTLLYHLDSAEVVSRLNAKAISLMQSGDFLTSMYLLRWVTERYPSTSAAMSVNNIAHNYQVLELNKLAIASYKKSIEIGQIERSYNSLISIAEIFLDLNLYDSASAYIDQAQLVYTEFPEQHPLSPDQLFIKKGRLLILKGSYEEALVELDKMRTTSTLLKWGSYYLQFIALDSLGDISGQHKIIRSALSLKVNYDVIPLRHLMMINWWQYLFYNQLNEHEMAKISIANYVERYKQMVNQEIVASILEEDMNNRILIEKNNAEFEKSILNKEISKNREQSYFLLVITVLLLLIAALIFSRYLKRKRLSSILEKQVELRTQELIEKNKQLAEYAFINAHKLRAPVARLLGLTSLAVYSENSQDLKDYFDLVKKESSDLDEVVHTITTAIGQSSNFKSRSN